MRGKAAVVTASALVVGVAVGLLGCSAEPGPDTDGGDTSQAPSASESESVTAAPSVQRRVPPERRVDLSRLRGDALCRLVEPGQLSKLAFPVGNGRARELGFDPPARACEYPADTGQRSVLIATQAPGMGRVGREEVEFSVGRGSQTRHVNDCAVFADVPQATLQVVVSVREAGQAQCEQAQSIAQYVLAGLAR